MNNLALENNTTEMISSRTIAESTGKTHTHVMRDIRNMCANADIPVTTSSPLSNQICSYGSNNEVLVIEAEYFIDNTLTNGVTSKKEYLLNEIAAELLATGYDVKRRLAVLKLIKTMRTKLEEKQFEIPKTLSSALMLAAQQAEQLELAAATIKEQAPKVELANTFLENTGTITLGNFAKVHGKMGRNTMFSVLRDLKVLQSRGTYKNTPYQWGIDRGYFEVVESSRNGGYGATIDLVTTVTTKGQQWLLEKLKEVEPSKPSKPRRTLLPKRGLGIL